MKVLHEIYGIVVGDDRYRSKLKMRLKNHFKEQISFVTPKYEIVIPTEYLDGGFLSHCSTRTVKAAANYLRDEISNAFKDFPELKWPPSLQEWSEPNSNLPQSIYTFLEMLINQGNHHAVPSTNLARLVELFAQDISSAVTRGK